MEFQLTNKNIRIRFILEKQRREAEGQTFTFQDMADKFEISDRTVYTWIAIPKHMQHLPKGSRERKVMKWLHDGVMETYFKSKGKK